MNKETYMFVSNIQLSARRNQRLHNLGVAGLRSNKCRGVAELQKTFGRQGRKQNANKSM